MYTSSATATERYTLLSTDRLSSELKDFDVENTDEHPPPRSRYVNLCAIASIFFVVFSYFLPISSAAGTRLPSFTSRAARLAYAGSLHRPSMYIGLPRLNRTAALNALPDKLVHFSHVFAPVSRSYPDKVWPTDGRARRTFNGVVSPGEPHVVIDRSNMTSMIMQVRVQDYGLERCSIAAILPSPSDSKLKEQNRTLTLGADKTRLDIWSLESRCNTELDLTSLNWHTRPARLSLIATITAEAGEEVRTPEFDCGASTSLRMFEIACAEDFDEKEACRIEFWQEQPEIVPRMAFVINQMPSL